MERCRHRPAVSEVLGSLVMISITLVAGTAFIGFINGQAGTSAGQLGAKVGANINSLSERLSVVFVHFTASSADIWVLNSGAVDTSISTVMISGIMNNGYASVLWCGTSIPSASCTGATCNSPSTTALSAVSLTASKNGVPAIPQDVRLTIPSIPSSCTSLQFLSGQSYSIVVVGSFLSSSTTTWGF